MSDTLYERYITGEDSTEYAHGTDWAAQTFTIGHTGDNVDHNITSVKLLLYITGSPGTCGVGIREVDGNDKPTGDDLTSNTFSANGITTDTGGEWVEITLTPYLLSASTRYAIVVSAPSGDGSNSLKWKVDGSSPGYTAGEWMYSEDSGETWTDGLGECGLFYEYGLVPSAAFMTPKKYW